MLKFYHCTTCDNLIEMIIDSGVTPNCCGDDMIELIPGTTDAAREKHVPIYTESSDLPANLEEKLCTRVITVHVGAAPHPMNKTHSIEWIAVCTDQGVYRKYLEPTQMPQADFCLKKSETIRAIYAYCNLHGLWVNIVNR